MCGFAGYFFAEAQDNRDNCLHRLMAAGQAIAHRGPDDAQAWLEEDNQLGLSFRRLAIRDLAETGRQPMHSACGRYVISFNGEIYNQIELQRALEAIHPRKWRGHSDTETILAAMAEWGIEEALKRLEGMFAIALWDRRDRQLFLARDRFGEKPLYWGCQGNSLYFGSEIKALKALGFVPGSLDRDSLALFFRFRYIPAPRTIHDNLCKLRPGELLRIRTSGGQLEIAKRLFWDTVAEALQASERPYAEGEASASAEMEACLTKSIRGRLASDVPLGAFLSGGIDSSLTAALARQVSPDLKTYTIRFEDPRFNEADHAMAVARHLETDHHEMTVTEGDALACVRDLAVTYDEPFADPSQIPTLLLCRQAQQHVTVALSGDGGDEFFAGYSRYLRIAEKWWNRPGSVQRQACGLLSGLPLEIFGPGGEKLRRKLINGAATSPEAYAQNEVGYWRTGVPVKALPGRGEETVFSAWPDPERLGSLDIYKRQMVSDACIYLPDDLQVKVDRAAMATSLEVRTPFLNQEVARLAWSMDSAMHITGAGQKNILKSILYRHVPQNLVERPKQGFDVPLREWLRGALKDWGEALVQQDDADLSDILDLDRIRAKWRQHQAGGRQEGDLWPALVFLDWWRHWQA